MEDEQDETEYKFEGSLTDLYHLHDLNYQANDLNLCNSHKSPVQHE